MVLVGALYGNNEIKQIEDFLMQEVFSWNKYLRAYIYVLLYSSGMRIDEAYRLVEKVRRKPDLIHEKQE